MKNIIAIVAFIATVYFSFSGVNYLIHYLCKGITDPNLQTFTIIILWALSLVIVLALALIIAGFVAAFLYFLIEGTQKSRERNRRLKSREFYNKKK